ncbi:hypothetical protein CDAR_455671 [Caerostris darwini]|uniref:Uncharacterized protein n=1 Tax=Caerostris darwini TaxID=1538125 RepID=A0AAV4SXF0_9ARAC|nr:hypothetical protein CDAR_455671 [Caerostris darwini]
MTHESNVFNINIIKTTQQFRWPRHRLRAAAPATRHLPGSLEPFDDGFSLLQSVSCQIRERQFGFMPKGRLPVGSMILGCIFLTGDVHGDTGGIEFTQSRKCNLYRNPARHVEATVAKESDISNIILVKTTQDTLDSQTTLHKRANDYPR